MSNFTTPLCTVCRQPLPWWRGEHICPLAGLLTPRILDLMVPDWNKPPSLGKTEG